MWRPHVATFRGSSRKLMRTSSGAGSGVHKLRAPRGSAGRRWLCFYDSVGQLQRASHSAGYVPKARLAVTDGAGRKDNGSKRFFVERNAKLDAVVCVHPGVDFCRLHQKLDRRVAIEALGVRSMANANQ